MVKFKAHATMLLFAFVIASSGVAFRAKPAEAGIGEAARFVSDNRDLIIAHVWSPNFLQVWMDSLSPQETRSIQEQFRSRAAGEIHARCVDRAVRLYWPNTGMQTNPVFRWVMITSRIENGQANCYARFQRQLGERFIRLRGF
jgi:hypothetical protein